jgi:hypothetical protein
MDSTYYSDATVNRFLKGTVCQGDHALYRYYMNGDVSKFRRRMQILKVSSKDIESMVYVFITDTFRDIILNFIGKLSTFLKPFGDMVISGGEAFNIYFNRKDRIVTSDIDTKFIPIFKTPSGKLVGPTYYKYFGYLQVVKLIIWDYLGKNCKKLGDQFIKRFQTIHGDRFMRMFGIRLPKEGPYITRRYSLIRKSKQSPNNSSNVVEGDVLIDVELFALDLNIRYYTPDDDKIKTRVLGGVLDIAIMRPFEIGFDVVYSRGKGMYYSDPVKKQIIFNPDIMIAGKKFLVEDLYILKSLGLRPKKKEKDRRRMVKFSKSVLGINSISSKDSDEKVFQKALKAVENIDYDKINIKNRPVMSTENLLSLTKNLDPSKNSKYVSHTDRRKVISQFMYGVRGPRQYPLNGFTKTSGPFRFDSKTKQWKKNSNPLYIKNEYNFRPNKKTVNGKMYIPNGLSLYSYVSTRNKWVPKNIINKAAMIPFVGLKRRNVK